MDVNRCFPAAVVASPTETLDMEDAPLPRFAPFPSPNSELWTGKDRKDQQWQCDELAFKVFIKID